MVGIFGVRGELKIAPSSIGEDALRAGLAVILRFVEDRPEQPATIQSVRTHKRQIVAGIDGIITADDAQKIVGSIVCTSRENAALAEGEYLDEDLIGCRLVEGERTVGKVAAVRHYPAQDVLELESGAFVPLVGAFVREIDVKARVVRVELPPGLVEGEPL